MKLNYKHTLISCCGGYVVQAIVNNLSPLLFIIYRERLGIEIWQISLLIALNFFIQTAIDLGSTLFVDRIGYRASVIIAHLFATVGLISLGILPLVMETKFLSLLISSLLMAVGGGLIEVIISPIVEAIPRDNKASRMNLLHSFYAWGQAGVILLSTVFFIVFERDLWYALPLIWSLIPIINTLAFCSVPICSLEGESSGSTLKYLFKDKTFWLLMIVMFAAGASELGISQWASFLAEEGLGLTKTMGDLCGPMLFAILMGIGRVSFGVFGSKLKIEKWIFASFGICVCSYLLCALSPLPILSLVGCALSGISVAIMWPGTYSYGAQKLPRGGTAMFALFALGGDIGCALGPAAIGLVTDLVNIGTADGLKLGILISAIFPLIAFFCMAYFLFLNKKRLSHLGITENKIGEV